MSVEPLRLVPEPAQQALEVFISRQPVVDREMRVTGYRVAYAAAENGERSATSLFGDVLSVVGLQELVGASLAHLPVSRELLLTLGIPPVRPDRVMLRVSHKTATDPDLRELLDELAGRGYALALYELPGLDFEPALLELFGTIEVDLSTWSDDDAAKAVKRILAGRATPLAVGVRDHIGYEGAKLLGFQLFSGSFFASPRLSEVRDVPVAGITSLVALVGLQGDAAKIEELERVIDHDVGLSVKLLRFINSAYFGMRSDISSIRQAVMMVGARGVSRWALMVALTSSPSTPRELSLTALIRARMCEILGMSRTDVSSDALFTVGLLSVADALLNRPLETIVGELPLTEELVAALLHRTGPAGVILEAVVAYEVANFGADSVQLHRAGVALAYMDALRWAQETIAEVA
jgi:c-di-GMP phosphodiesterase